MLKRFFSLWCMVRLLACVEHKALPFLDSLVPCWRFPPNLFPIRAGRGGRCQHLREWGGSCRLLKGSPQPMWQPAVLSVCVYACAFVMNPPPAIVCSPPCSRQWNLSPGLLPADGPSSKIGGGRAACGN